MKTIFGYYFNNIAKDKSNFLSNFKDSILKFSNQKYDKLLNSITNGSYDEQFNKYKEIFLKFSDLEQKEIIDFFFEKYLNDEERKILNDSFFVKKLKEKIIPDLQQKINIKDIYKIQTERLDLYFLYYENPPLIAERNNIGFGEYVIKNYVGVVGYLKNTEEYVGYLEISQHYDKYKPKIKITSMPWMFLSQNPVDYRRKGFMFEIMSGIIKYIRKNFPFFKDEIIYSGNTLSKDAENFFNKLVANGYAKINRKKQYPKYQLLI